MNNNDFLKALEKMKSCCELDNSDIIEYMQSEGPKRNIVRNAYDKFLRFQRGKDKKIDFKDLDLYFSIYNAEANIAISKKTNLITRIYFQLKSLQELINKWVQEQKPKEEEKELEERKKTEERRKIARAKQLHFEDIVNLFNNNILQRDSFYFEDEIYYRICEAKKSLKIYAKKDAYLNNEIKILDNLENTVIDLCYKKRELTKNDVIKNIKVLNEVIEEYNFSSNKLQKNNIDSLISNLNKRKEIFPNRNNSEVDKEEVAEYPGSLTNYSVVLDEFFDKFESIEDDLAIDITDKDSYAYYDKNKEKKGLKPIYFISKEHRYYFKTYISKKIWKNNDSQEYGHAIEEKIKKLEEYVKKQNNNYLSKNKILSNEEKKKKEKWEMIQKDIKNWKSKNKRKINLITRKALNKETINFEREMFEPIDFDA